MLKCKWLYFAILWATHQKWSIFNFFLYFTLPRHQKGEEVLPGLGSIFERLQIILQSYFMPAFFPLDMLHDSLETDSTSVLATADLIAQGKQVLTQTLFLQAAFIFYSTVYQASCSNCIHGNVLQKMLCLTHAFTDTSNLRR